MALLELHVAIARVLWLYDWRMVEGTENTGVGPNGEYAIKEHFIV